MRKKRRSKLRPPGKPKKQIWEGMSRTSLTLPQVRMIYRIYWTDKYQRHAAGFTRTTRGIFERLGKTFGVSTEVIRQIAKLRDNQHGKPKRERFPTIALKSIRRNVKNRKANRYGSADHDDEAAGA
jgi:hypothetical protein